MDLLRAVLQPSFNDDIMAVFRKYHMVCECVCVFVCACACAQVSDGVVLSSMQFFEKAAHNVKENVGDEVHTDQLIKDACRNVLEHVRV